MGCRVGMLKLSRNVLGLAMFGTAHSVMAIEGLPFSVTVSSQDAAVAAVDTALDELCPNFLPGAATGSLLGAVCTFTAGSPAPEQVAEVFKEISAKVNSSPGLLESRAPAVNFSGDVSSRVGALLQSAKRNSFRPKLNAQNNKSTFSAPIFRAGSNPEAEGGLYSQRLSGYVNGTFSSADQRETTTEMGFDSSGQGMVVGVDYRLGLNTSLGVAPQFNRTSATLTDEGSELKSTQYGIILYGSHFLNDAWYVEGTLGRSSQQLELSREIAFTIVGQDPVLLTALGETAGARTSLSLGTGYGVPLQYNANMALSANLVYAASSIEGYSEKNAGDLSLTVAGQESSSTTTRLTASVSRVFSFKSGVLIPQLGVAWLHEFNTKGEQVQAKFTADTGASQFGFVTRGPDADYFVLNADGQFLIPGAGVAYARLSNVRLLRDRSATALTVGYRVEF